MSSPQAFGNDYLPPPSPSEPSGRHPFFSKVTFFVLVVCLAAFLIFLLQAFARRCCFRRSRSTSFRRQLIYHLSTLPPAAPAGLDAATIAKLPTFTHTVSMTSDSSTAPLLECAVCLSDFQANELGRLLPSCKHAFHTECIDMWLSSHSTCPLCRMLVLPVTSPADATADGLQTLSASLNTEENPVVDSNAVQLPGNELSLDNQARLTSSHEPSSSVASINCVPTAPAESRLPLTRSYSQITIEIPPINAGVVLSITTPRSCSLSKPGCLQEGQASGSSEQTMIRSPGLAASLKRMLNRKSSWHTERTSRGLELPQ